MSNLDYQFLAASQECDRRETQLIYEAEGTKEINARLMQERKTARIQRLLLIVIPIKFVTALIICGRLFAQLSLYSGQQITVTSRSKPGRVNTSWLYGYINQILKRLMAVLLQRLFADRLIA